MLKVSKKVNTSCYSTTLLIMSYKTEKLVFSFCICLISNDSDIQIHWLYAPWIPMWPICSYQWLKAETWMCLTSSSNPLLQLLIIHSLSILWSVPMEIIAITLSSQLPLFFTSSVFISLWEKLTFNDSWNRSYSVHSLTHTCQPSRISCLKIPYS